MNCHECGSRLRENDKYCTSCGQEIDFDNTSDRMSENESVSEANKTRDDRVGNPTKQDQSLSTDLTDSVKPENDEIDNTYFDLSRYSFYLIFICYFLYAITKNIPILIFCVICLLISVIAMYIDLRRLETRVYRTRPITWVIGAILAWLIAIPIYIFKRRSHKQ